MQKKTGVTFLHLGMWWIAYAYFMFRFGLCFVPCIVLCFVSFCAASFCVFSGFWIHPACTFFCKHVDVSTATRLLISCRCCAACTYFPTERVECSLAGSIWGFLGMSCACFTFARVFIMQNIVSLREHVNLYASSCRAFQPMVGWNTAAPCCDSSTLWKVPSGMLPPCTTLHVSTH